MAASRSGQGWDQIRFPKVDDENAYALEVTGDCYAAALSRRRHPDRLAQFAPPRKGDRVVVRTTDGEVMAKILVRRTAKTVELASFNPAHPNLVVSRRTASTGWRASSGRASKPEIRNQGSKDSLEWPDL